MSSLKNLPLEGASELLASVFVFWGKLTDSLPAEQVPLIMYVVCSAIVLLLWLWVMRLIPRPFKGISWVACAAILFAPGQAAGGSGEMAPAMIGVFHAILMKDFGAAMTASLPIFAVFAALLIVGAIWQLLRSVIAADDAKKAETLRIQEEKRRLAAQTNSQDA